MPNKIIQFGDIHGNATTTLLTLKETGLVTNLTADLYEKFETAYNNNNVKDFFALVDQLEFNPEMLENKQLIYCGDILADLGKNDAFNLYLLLKMAKSNIQYDILYSNHDHEFIKNIYYMRQREYDKIESTIPNKDQSLLNFKASLINKEIEASLLDEMIDNYLNRLTLMSCHRNHEDIPHIAQHAPLNEHMIDRILQETKSKATLEQKIDHLNNDFKTHTLPILVGDPSTEAYKTYEAQVHSFRDALKTKKDVYAETPLAILLMWNRGYPENENLLEKLVDKQAGITEVHDTHGHDEFGFELYNDGHNIDNTIGLNGSTPFETDLSPMMKEITAKPLKELKVTPILFDQQYPENQMESSLVH
ncbi:hypothetical protein L3V83_04535 [Thiotrichales bacterium 19X7-9]|nr:hypothetical protein [Thiotrichales bacterium 19X7-9]